MLWNFMGVMILGGFPLGSAENYTLNRNHGYIYTAPHEARLRQTLVSRYAVAGNRLRPLQNSSHPMSVQYGMRLIKMTVDEASQSLKTSVWIRMKWYDQLLTWNKDDYGGMRRLTFSPNTIWTPHDVTIANTIETKIEERKVDVRVSYTGMVFWTPHRQYISECLLDLTYYPYDTHTCSIWIQSLAGYGDQVDLQLYSFKARQSTPWELETYMKSHAETQEWQITHNGSERVESSRNHSVVLMYSNKVALRFTLTIQRRPGFVAYLLMFPGLVLSFIATLTFCLPPERPDRNMLAMSLFMSFMVLLLILLESVPPSARAIPKLVRLYCFNLSIAVACIFCSIIVINISRFGTDSTRVPARCLQKFFFRFLARLFCLSDRVLSLYNVQSAQELILPSTKDCAQDKSKSNSDDNKASPSACQQWKMIAFILDRCLFTFFIAANIVAAIVFFPLPRSA